MSERPTTTDFGYNPTLGLIPEMSLPDNLPELDNYATFDDTSAIDWTKQQMTSIAPSLAMSMLPDIGDLSATATAPPVEPPKPAGNYSLEAPLDVSTVFVSIVAPAPPPVDIPAIIPLTSAASSVPPPAPPPPPPPAPPMPTAAPSVLAPPATLDELPAPTVNTTANNDDDDGGNAFLAEIRNFGKTNKLRSTAKTNPVDDAAPLANPNEQESIMETLKKRLAQRRGLIAGDTAPSSSSAAAAANAAVPPPSPATGGAFTDAIAAKAKEVADAKQRQRDDSDESDENDEDWE